MHLDVAAIAGQEVGVTKEQAAGRCYFLPPPPLPAAAAPLPAASAAEAAPPTLSSMLQQQAHHTRPLHWFWWKQVVSARHQAVRRTLNHKSRDRTESAARHRCQPAAISTSAANAPHILLLASIQFEH